MAWRQPPCATFPRCHARHWCLGTGACEAHDEAEVAQAVQAGRDSTVCLDRVLEGEEPSADHSLVRHGPELHG
jgi:hypothetical protein